MAQNLTCDGCGKAEEDGEQFTRRGYIATVDYCPKCLGIFEVYDQERRNLSVTATQGYIESAAVNKANFLAENPSFNLPDGDED